MSEDFKVLLAEDEAVLREELCDALTAEGCVVRAAEDGAEALAALEAGWRPDILLSDRMMPVMDGDALLRAVRADLRWADLPFVFMTALAGEAQEMAGLRGGADGYVTKPVRAPVLAERLRAVARGAGRARAGAAADLERRRAAFLSIIPHELRTPLTPILGYSDILRADRSLPPRVRDMAQHINDGAAALLQRINDLIDVGAAAHNGLIARRDDASLADIVSDAVALCAGTAEARRIRVDERYSDHVLRVDPRLMRRALAAVLDNAVKFAADGGSVDIRAETDAQGGLLVDVSDDGPGFDAAARAAATRIFEQGDASHTRQHGGQGLGLPLARAVCTAHGGDLEIGEAEGGGARVRLRIPGEAARVAA